MSSALQKLAGMAQKDGKQKIKLPPMKSFGEFLSKMARVRAQDGSYVPYHLKGRKPLARVIEKIDEILDKGRKDVTLAICGGAQFGKTILVLNLVAFLMGWRFRNVTYFLPDDDLVQGVVDTKLRPDVIDQIPSFAELCRVGKAINESGKAVNRKGAFMVTDGERVAQGYMRGLNKIPTTLSADVVIVDERDDVDEDYAKFIPGRLTASNLRLIISIGTQRIHGAGQNKEFLDGTQHVFTVACPCCSTRINLEEKWPQICRIAMEGRPQANDPQLTPEGDFKCAGSSKTSANYDPDATYYLACPEDGAVLDPDQGDYEARFPDRERLGKISFRLQQLAITAIELRQLVSDWCQNAVRDPQSMIAFYCDRLGIPKNTSQALDPKIIKRAQDIEVVELSMTPSTRPIFIGLDMGDRCWLMAREVESPFVKRVRWLEQVSSGNVVPRAEAIFHMLGARCLFVDLRPLVNDSRELCFRLNGITEQNFNKDADLEHSRLSFSSGLVWDGELQRWFGLRCAAVEFALRDTQGIKHKLGRTDDGKVYPVIQCNRDQSIQRAVNEFLTPTENVIELIKDDRGMDVVRTDPSIRLPASKPGAPRILETFKEHLLVGSQKEKTKDGKEEHFVDQVENHLLLADSYSALAEVMVGIEEFVPGVLKDVSGIRSGGNAYGKSRFFPRMLNTIRGKQA